MASQLEVIVLDAVSERTASRKAIVDEVDSKVRSRGGFPVGDNDISIAIWLVEGYTANK